ncbi:MAG: tetratricopeptide repeat protein [Desulfuromonadales bacterium]
MSLLADLLSKNKPGASRGNAEKPPGLDVPPTLSKARGIHASVRKLNIRYVVIMVVSVAFVALGAFVTAKFKSHSTTVKKKPPLQPRTVQQPALFKDRTSAATPPPAATALPPAEPARIARITLEEPPAPVSVKKHKALHKAKKVRCPPQQPAGKSPATPKSAPEIPAQKIESSIQQTAAQPRQKPFPPLKIDTAARDSLLYAARSSEQNSDWKSALASYRKAQEIDPGDYKIMSNVAAVLNNLGMFDEGAQEAERALAKKPDYVPALINAAIGYSSMGNSQKALRHFTHASAIEPGNRNLIINLGTLHERSGNLDDALATYRQLAGAGDPLALQGVGRVYERKGNRSEAIRAYRQIMALPNATPALKKDVKGRLARLEE